MELNLKQIFGLKNFLTILSLSSLGVDRVRAGQGELDGGGRAHVIGPNSLGANFDGDQKMEEKATNSGQGWSRETKNTVW